MSVLSLILALAAFALFGIATHEHSRRRLGRPLASQLAQRLRFAAWVALVAAFPPAIAAQGWIFGPVLWLGGVMLGAGVVFLALNFVPQRKSN